MPEPTLEARAFAVAQAPWSYGSREVSSVIIDLLTALALQKAITLKTTTPKGNEP